MAAEISRLKKKQSANRNVVNGLIAKAVESMNKGRNADTIGEVAAFLRTIKSKEKLLEDVKDDICNLVEEDEMAEFIEEAANFEVKVARDVPRMEEFVLQRSATKRDTEFETKDFDASRKCKNW